MDAKTRGNHFFLEKKYDQALACYSDAISEHPRAATGYTNRALCHLKLSQWTAAAEDCQKAVQLDPSSVKANFYWGQALLAMENFDDAIVTLKTAHELAKEQRKNYGEDITTAIRLAKKGWSALEEKRLKQEGELQSFLTSLLLEHKERQLSALDVTASPDVTKTRMEEVHKEYSDRLSELDQLFQEVDEKRKHREVPDFMCGKISFELMTEPYITPSGITYERKDIEEHLQRVGHFDPVTREALTQDQLIPNLAMKEVVDSFVANNGWVEEY